MTNRYFIAGMNHRAGAEELLRSLKPGFAMKLIREPSNPHDPNAIQVYAEDKLVGHVRGYQAKTLAPMMDAVGTSAVLGALAFTDGHALPVVDIEIGINGA